MRKFAKTERQKNRGSSSGAIQKKKEKLEAKAWTDAAYDKSMGILH